jgi:transposase
MTNKNKVFKYLTKGLTPSQIADKTGLSVHTVYSYRKIWAAYKITTVTPKTYQTDFLNKATSSVETGFEAQQSTIAELTTQNKKLTAALIDQVLNRY